MHPCDLLEKLVPGVRRAVASVCRRRGVFDLDAEDIEQEVMVKLAADDCAALYGLRDESNATTFVWTVATRVILDGIRERRGRWRPSTVARGLGATAVMLETLLFRDGWSYEEAVEKLLAERVRESREELDAMRAKLPDRPVRSFVAEQAIADSGSPEVAAEDVSGWERQTTQTRLERVFPRIMDELEPEDRLILKRLFLSGRSVAQVAQELEVEQRPLYRRRDRILQSLRNGLEAEGLSWAEVCRLMGWHELDLGLDDGEEHEQE
jgi:RNA polymerase sigma factor (sigma-70 family)